MSTYNLSGLNVLVIEQHSLIRDAIRGALEAMNVKKVRLANNVRKAFIMMQGDKPDLILTDWSPGLDGIELMDLIRKDRHSPDVFVPVVIMSAYSEAHHVNKAINAGINDFLKKPISASSIFSRIKWIIENPRLYVRSGPYFGPCRRRSNEYFDGFDRRRRPTYEGRERRQQQLPFRGKERRFGYQARAA